MIIDKRASTHQLDEAIVKDLSTKLHRPREEVAAAYREELESLLSNARVHGFASVIAARKTRESFLNQER